VRFTAVFKVAA